MKCNKRLIWYCKWIDIWANTYSGTRESLIVLLFIFDFYPVNYKKYYTTYMLISIKLWQHLKYEIKFKQINGLWLVKRNMQGLVKGVIFCL